MSPHLFRAGPTCARDKTTGFELFPPVARFANDTVLTLATAEAPLGDGDYADAYRRYCRTFTI